MRVRLLGVCVVSFVGLTACGESSSSSTDSGGTGSSTSGANAGGSASGGSPAAGASNGGQPSAGSSSAGTASSGTTSGGNSSSGGAPNPPSALPNIECAAGDIVYRGKVGGAAVMESLKPTGPATGGATVNIYGGGGSILSLDEGAAKEGTLAGGILVFPEGSAHAGKIWCIDQGSLIGKGTIRTGALIGHLLGTCPGTAVAGTLHACFDSAQGYCDDEATVEKQSFSGELAGKVINSPNFGLTTLATRAWAATTDQFDFGLFAASDPTTASAAKVTGFFAATVKNPEFGDVYCVNDGQWKKYSDDFVLNANQATLSSIGYVGSCKDAGPTEALDVCFGR